MQDNNYPDVKKRLICVANYLKVKGIRGLASELGEKESRLYAWIRNESIVDTGAILTKCPNINIEWLKTGKGEMFGDTTDNPTVSEPAPPIYDSNTIDQELNKEMQRYFSALSEEGKKRVIHMAKGYLLQELQE